MKMFKRKNKGLFATQGIAPGEKLVDYSGDYMFPLDYEKKWKQSQLYVDVKHGLLFIINNREDVPEDKIADDITSGLTLKKCIETRKFPLKYAEDYNCEFHMKNSGEFAEVYLRAIKEISEGELLLVKYPDGFWVNHYRGRIDEQDFLKWNKKYHEELRKKYIKDAPAN